MGERKEEERKERKREAFSLLPKVTLTLKRMGRGYTEAVGLFIYLFFSIQIYMGLVICTSSAQQGHNTLSHGGGSQCVGPTPM
jgi:hypothetical protein